MQRNNTEKYSLVVKLIKLFYENEFIPCDNFRFKFIENDDNDNFNIHFVKCVNDTVDHFHLKEVTRLSKKLMGQMNITEIDIKIQADKILCQCDVSILNSDKKLKVNFGLLTDKDKSELWNNYKNIAKIIENYVDELQFKLITLVSCNCK